MKLSCEEIIELISEFAKVEGIQVEVNPEKFECRNQTDYSDSITDCVIKPVSYVLHNLPIAKISCLIVALQSIVGHIDVLDLVALKAIIFNNPELRKQIHLTVLDYLKSLEMKPVETKAEN